MAGHDWPGGAPRHAVAVAPVGGSATRTTGSRWPLATAPTAMPAWHTGTRALDSATRRKRERPGTLSRPVCVTRIKRLRRGVPGNGHAPLWSSGRRSDPLADCNRLNLSRRQRVAAMGRRSATPCKRADGLHQQLVLFQVYHNFVLPHASLREALAEPIPTNGRGSAKVWRPCTSAMAAGLTDHGWSLRKVLLFRVPPWPQPQTV
jgi:hypothetical protein